jgi:isochorismate synthase
MRTADIKGSVIWRLPGSDVIQTLETSEGNDSFIFSYFDKSKKPLSIQGTIKAIAVENIGPLLNGWSLRPCENKASSSKEDYKAWVEKAKARIKQADLIKVVIARREWHEGKIDLYKLFMQLLSRYTNAFVYAFNLGEEGIMIGASPETLLRRQAGILLTEALGGTMTRGTYGEKEIQEHGHIRLYLEECLAKAGYDYVVSPTTARQAGDVQHLLTGFTLESKGYLEDIELAKVLHPTSAVCGMPYEKAIDFIRHSEDFDRRYYSGFLGPVYADGDFSLFVNLRCAEVYADGVVLYAGAGLNAMSDAEDEWDETHRKMETISKCL